MNRLVFSIYRVIVPKPVRTMIVRRSLRRKILDYYKALPPSALTAEINEVTAWLESNSLEIFPYNFAGKYVPGDVEVLTDDESKSRYVFLDGRKLYFKKRWTKKRIRKGFSDLLREQDPASPHRYLVEGFDVNENDVVADIGAAEGNFSLSIVERVKKIYIFEYNPGWVAALEKTFAPWKDKVEIINKRVADFDDEKHVRFDTFLRDREEITFMKIDVDGAEQSVLNSSKRILAGSHPLKIALCTYHRNNDESDFTTLLQGFGFTVTASKGYMIHFYDKQIKAPYLRRGLIRGIRG
jgi:hypothetical protein